MPVSEHTDHLRALAEVLLDTVDPEQPPMVVGITLDHEGATLAMRALLRGDPAAELRGFRAPGDWSAMAVAARSRVHHLDDRTRPAEAAGFVQLLCRDGTGFVLLRQDGEPEPRVVGDEGGGEGRLMDTCRRVLGLPTPAARSGTAALVHARWLDDVLIGLLADTCAPRWDEVAARHPLRSVPGEIPPDERRPEALAAATRRWSTTWPWSRLWANARTHGAPLVSVDPVVADWADEGSFARLVMEAYPERRDLLDALTALLPAGVIELLRAALAVRPGNASGG